MKFQFLENIADKRVTYTKCLFTFASLYRSHSIIPDDTHTHKKTEDTYTSKLIVILRRLFLHTKTSQSSCRYIYMPHASLIAQLVKNPPAMLETPVWFLGGEDPLENR